MVDLWASLLLRGQSGLGELRVDLLKDPLLLELLFLMNPMVGNQ